MPESGLIPPLLKRFSDDFFYTPVVAAEIEFYLYPTDRDVEPFRRMLMARCEQAGITVFKWEKERGEGQYEVALAPAESLKAVRDTQALKALIFEVATECGLKADLSAKPHASQPGSGLHIHIHLADGEGINVFYKDDQIISNSLYCSIGGLLAWLPDCMPVFAPSNESYARFVPSPQGQAPLNVSWGANNRTVAVRLPDAAHHVKRVEHRVAGADADVEKVVAVLLASIHDGIRRTLEPGEQMYGDAALAKYDLPKFPTTLEEAVERMQQSSALKNYFNVSDLLPAR